MAASNSAQRSSGELPEWALAEGGVDGDVQAGAPHRLAGRGEAAGVAELGPQRHPGDLADAVGACSARQPGWQRANAASRPRWRVG